jgi:hypothetical protein
MTRKVVARESSRSRRKPQPGAPKRTPEQQAAYDEMRAATGGNKSRFIAEVDEVEPMGPAVKTVVVFDGEAEARGPDPQGSRVEK